MSPGKNGNSFGRRPASDSVILILIDTYYRCTEDRLDVNSDGFFSGKVCLRDRGRGVLVNVDIRDESVFDASGEEVWRNHRKRFFYFTTIIFTENALFGACVIFLICFSTEIHTNTTRALGGNAMTIIILLYTSDASYSFRLFVRVIIIFHKYLNFNFVLVKRRTTHTCFYLLWYVILYTYVSTYNSIV